MSASVALAATKSSPLRSPWSPSSRVRVPIDPLRRWLFLRKNFVWLIEERDHCGLFLSLPFVTNGNVSDARMTVTAVFVNQEFEPLFLAHLDDN